MKYINIYIYIYIDWGYIEIAVCQNLHWIGKIFVHIIEDDVDW